MIHELLSHGEANARTGRDLAAALDCGIREVSEIVEHERRAGRPICASTGTNPGYYLASCKREMTAYCDSLKRRIREIERTRRACINTIDNLPEAIGGNNGIR